MNIHGAGATPAPPAVAVEAGLESEIQAHLGHHLRAIYDEVATQPVPDRFLKLLQQLEQASGKTIKTDKASGKDDS